MIYKTNNALAMARFFLEINYDDFMRKLNIFEDCHGKTEELNLLFFAGDPGKLLPAESTYFSSVKSYNFTDAVVSGNFSERQVIISLA